MTSKGRASCLHTVVLTLEGQMIERYRWLFLLFEVQWVSLSAVDNSNNVAFTSAFFLPEILHIVEMNKLRPLLIDYEDTLY